MREALFLSLFVSNTCSVHRYQLWSRSKFVMRFTIFFIFIIMRLLSVTLKLQEAKVRTKAESKRRRNTRRFNLASFMTDLTFVFQHWNAIKSGVRSNLCMMYSDLRWSCFLMFAASFQCSNAWTNEDRCIFQTALRSFTRKRFNSPMKWIHVENDTNTSLVRSLLRICTTLRHLTFWALSNAVVASFHSLKADAFPFKNMSISLCLDRDSRALLFRFSAICSFHRTNVARVVALCDRALMNLPRHRMCTEL